MSVPIGILGGVFDPVHYGHLAVASLARDFLGLQSVLFIPSGSPPHKDSVDASAKHRLAMLHLALDGVSWATICDQELHRQGYSYTIDTISTLRKDLSEPFYFIIGSDNLREISSWHRYRELLTMVTLCVAHRPGYSEEIPLDLKGANIVHFPSPEWGLSSSMIRAYISKGYPCNYLIPDNIVDYIQNNNLYSQCVGAKEKSHYLDPHNGRL